LELLLKRNILYPTLLALLPFLVNLGWAADAGKPDAEREAGNGEAAKRGNDTDVEMFTGEARVFGYDTARIAVGNGKAISVSTLSNHQILVLAESVGTSSLHLWLRDGGEREMTVTVINSNMKHTLTDVTRLLQGVDNVTARIAGNKIVLEGEMVSDANQARVQDIVKMYPEMVVNFVGKVGWEKMITLDVRVLDLTDTAAKNLGVAWGTSVNGPAAGVVGDLASNSLYRYTPDLSSQGVSLASGASSLPNRVWPPKGFLSLATAITSQINLMVQNGQANLLASPSLTTRSGGKAKFIAGGEIPIPVNTGFGQVTIEYKEYGVIMEVTPVADKSGNIYAKVDIEVSNLDPSVVIAGYPAILKRQSSSEFNSRDGDAVVISGLYSYTGTSTTDKVPGLGSAPVVGGLFRNNNTNDQRRQVAVVITPRITTATPTLDRLPADPNTERLNEIDQNQRTRTPQKPPEPHLSVVE
jgi:pilus assembly protein CpaC